MASMNESPQDLFLFWRNQQLRNKEILYLGSYLLISQVVFHANVWHALCCLSLQVGGPVFGKLQQQQQQHCPWVLDPEAAAGAMDMSAVLQYTLAQNGTLYSLACGTAEGQAWSQGLLAGSAAQAAYSMLLALLRFPLLILLALQPMHRPTWLQLLRTWAGWLLLLPWSHARISLVPRLKEALLLLLRLLPPAMVMVAMMGLKSSGRRGVGKASQWFDAGCYVTMGSAAWAAFMLQVPMGVQVWVGLLEWLLWHAAWSAALAAGLAAGPCAPADHVMGLLLCYLLPTAAVAWQERLLLAQFDAKQKRSELMTAAAGGRGQGVVDGFRAVRGKQLEGSFLQGGMNTISNSSSSNRGSLDDGGCSGDRGSRLSRVSDEMGGVATQAPQTCQAVGPHQQQQQQQQQQQVVAGGQASSRARFVYRRPPHHLVHRKVAFKIHDLEGLSHEEASAHVTAAFQSTLARSAPGGMAFIPQLACIPGCIMLLAKAVLPTLMGLLGDRKRSGAGQAAAAGGGSGEGVSAEQQQEGCDGGTEVGGGHAAGWDLPQYRNGVWNLALPEVGSAGVWYLQFSSISSFKAAAAQGVTGAASTSDPAVIPLAAAAGAVDGDDEEDGYEAEPVAVTSWGSTLQLALSYIPTTAAAAAGGAAVVGDEGTSSSNRIKQDAAAAAAVSGSNVNVRAVLVKGGDVLFDHEVAARVAGSVLLVTLQLPRCPSGVGDSKDTSGAAALYIMPATPSKASRTDAVTDSSSSGTSSGSGSSSGTSSGRGSSSTSSGTTSIRGSGCTGLPPLMQISLLLLPKPAASEFALWVEEEQLTQGQLQPLLEDMVVAVEAAAAATAAAASGTRGLQWQLQQQGGAPNAGPADPLPRPNTAKAATCGASGVHLQEQEGFHSQQQEGFRLQQQEGVVARAGVAVTPPMPPTAAAATDPAVLLKLAAAGAERVMGVFAECRVVACEDVMAVCKQQLMVALRRLQPLAAGSLPASAAPVLAAGTASLRGTGALPGPAGAAARGEEQGAAACAGAGACSASDAAGAAGAAGKGKGGRQYREEDSAGEQSDGSSKGKVNERTGETRVQLTRKAAAVAAGASLWWYEWGALVGWRDKELEVGYVSSRLSRRSRPPLWVMMGIVDFVFSISTGSRVLTNLMAGVYRTPELLAGATWFAATSLLLMTPGVWLLLAPAKLWRYVGPLAIAVELLRVVLFQAHSIIGGFGALEVIFRHATNKSSPSYAIVLVLFTAVRVGLHQLSPPWLLPHAVVSACVQWWVYTNTPSAWTALFPHVPLWVQLLLVSAAGVGAVVWQETASRVKYIKDTSRRGAYNG